MKTKFCTFLISFLFITAKSWCQAQMLIEEPKITQVDHSVIVCDGDSRTVGYTGKGYYPYSHYLGFDSTYHIFNTAKGGASLVYWKGVDCIPDNATNNVDKLYSKLAINNIIVIWAGYNDMYVNDIDQRKTYRALVAYSRERKLKGWKVIVCTEINAASVNGRLEPRRLAFNELVRNNWRDFADGLCDLGSTEYFNRTNSSEDSTYYYDGAHLTSLGYSAIGTAVKRSIVELLNRPSYNYKSIVIQVFSPKSSVAAGTDLAQFTIPIELEGYVIKRVSAHSYNPGDGFIKVQIKNSNSAEAAAKNEVLSTECTIYNGYYDSRSFGVPNSVIGNNIVVKEGYVISIDVKQVETHTRKGLDVRIDFSKD